MHVDVVLVTYNSAERLPSCLATVAGLFDLDRDALWVVDNASMDGSAELAARLEPRASVIRNAVNEGFAAAVNRAVSEGEREIIALVNPDVVDARGSSAEVRRAFESSDVGAAAVRMVDASGEVQRTCHSFPTPWTMLSENLALHARFPRWRAARAYRMLDWDLCSARDVEDACGGFLFLRREVWEEIGPFDERFFVYFEETDWLRRMRDAGYRTVFTPAVEVSHVGGGSVSDVADDGLQLLLIESGYAYLRKWDGRLAETGTRVVFALLDMVRLLGAVLSRDARTRARRAARRLRVHLGGRVAPP